MKEKDRKKDKENGKETERDRKRQKETERSRKKQKGTERNRNIQKEPRILKKLRCRRTTTSNLGS